MSTRTIVTLQIEVHDPQASVETMTAAEIRGRATKLALDEIAKLNRSNLRVVGDPSVRMVIVDDAKRAAASWPFESWEWDQQEETTP